MLATEAGWHDGAEVVTVRFDPDRISYEKLLERAVARECATAGAWVLNDAQRKLARGALGERVKDLSGTPRPDKEPKYYLFKSPYRALPLTELQAVRINALLVDGKPFDELLSPRQRALAVQIRAEPDAEWPQLVGVPIGEAWQRIELFLRARAEVSETGATRRDG